VSERVAELMLVVFGGPQRQQSQRSVLIGAVGLGVSQHRGAGGGVRRLAIPVGDAFERLRG
jgi:hypothetical protein